MKKKHTETLEGFALDQLHGYAYDLIVKTWATDKAVLDVGCGNGYGCEIMRDKARMVFGVDIDRVVVKDKIHLHIYHADAKRLPFQPNSIDTVTSLQVIEHIDNISAYLNEIKRVLTPGGVAIFTTPNADMRLDAGSPPWNPEHTTEYTPDGLYDALSGYFGSTIIRGISLIEPLLSIEMERIKRAKGNAKRKARNPIWRATLGAAAKLRRGPEPLTPEVIEKHGNYACCGYFLDPTDCIDLLAVCRERRLK